MNENFIYKKKICEEMSLCNLCSIRRDITKRREPYNILESKKKKKPTNDKMSFSFELMSMEFKYIVSKIQFSPIAHFTFYYVAKFAMNSFGL